MQLKNTSIKLLVALAVMIVPCAAAAQSSSINAFSPYTMYGIGEQNTPGTLPMRSMGGMGVAMRSSGTINLLNPAAYSAAAQKSFLFNFGLEGQNYYNSQTVEGVNKKSSYNSFNFHDVAIQIPVAKKLGLGVSLAPYSSVGYRTKYVHQYDPTDPVWGNVGQVEYAYQGEGDLTEVKLGMGWEIFKRFSLGVAVQYYWGDLTRTFTMTPYPFTGEGTFVPTIGEDKYSISSFKGQVGVQWDVIKNPAKRILTVGATFDFGGDLKPRSTHKIHVGDLSSTVVKGDTVHLALVLPHQLSAGVFYQTPKWAVGVDYAYQNWGGRNKQTERTGVSGTGQNSYTVAYANTNTIKVGAEFTPNRFDVRSFMKRVSYRAGFRYGTYNQTYNDHTIAQYAFTAGVGIPVRLYGVSAVDIGVEYGRRGYNIPKSVGLVRQQYFKFAIGFTLFASGSENNEYWFLRPKYD